MASNCLKECSVCDEDFDEGARCPRSLPCSHYLCTDCINKLISRNSKQCPFCRYQFQANSADNVMVNRAVLDFLKNLTPQNTQNRTQVQKVASPLSQRIEYLKMETVAITNSVISACDDAQSDTEDAIQKIERIMQQLHFENAKIEDEILQKLHKIKEHNHAKMKELENKSISNSNYLKAILKKKIQLEYVQQKLNRAKTFKEAATVMDEAEESNATIGKWAEKRKVYMAKEKEILQTTAEAVQEAKESIEEIMESLSFFKEEIKETNPIPSMTPVTSPKEIPKQLTIEVLQGMSDQLKVLLKQGRVFAVDNDHRVRSARITFHDEKLLLHHLIEGPPPDDAHVIKHMDVLRLVTSSSILTFLELGTSDLTLGKLYIRLSPDNIGGKQFAFLCTGQMGPSYANSRLLHVISKGFAGEKVGFGDYEHQTGQGGKALVTGLQPLGKYAQPALSGTVTGIGWKSNNEAVSAQFFISTRSNPEKNCCSAFGIVEVGLNVLTEAIARYPKIREVFVTECGLVLPSR